MSQLKTPKLSMIYGTAWKKEHTTTLVSQALRSGFKAIDTAAQPKHYQEHLVGEGIRAFLSTSKNIRREDLHLQTKYTSFPGQDPKNLPYDPKTSITEQVKASVASSLWNLRHNDKDNDAYLDCLLLHSPLHSFELTMEAWKAMSAFVPHHVRSLGISNVTLPILEAIYDNADIKPSAVQNRFHAATGYDVPLRSFCSRMGIKYQSFWTLTANPGLLRSKVVVTFARDVGVSREAALYGLVQGLGIVVVNGTTSHMEEDVGCLELIERWKTEKSEDWKQRLQEFAGLLGDS